MALIMFFSFAHNEPIYTQNRELNTPLKEAVYDLIVYGSSPEGIAAATVGGEKGLKVLLVDEQEELGGLMTSGRLNFIDMNYDENGLLLTQGIFSRFYEAVEGNAFEIDKANEVFKTFLLDSNVDVEQGINFIQVNTEKEKIKSIVVDKNAKRKTYQGSFFIDASPDGDLAAMANVPFTLFGEDVRKKDSLMGVTLVFELEQVNWPKVFSFLNYNRYQGKKENDERQFYGASLNTAWGYSIEGYKYEPHDEQMRLRGLNAARQKDGGVLVNALIIFDVNPIDPESKKLALERGKKELEYIVPYLNESFSGFENAKLKSVADELYVRESRHFVTDYVLTIDDVLENRNFPNQIALASYPVDVQPAVPGDFGKIIGNPARYGIPYGSLLPKEYTNLLLTGKHAGYSSLAAGSARVIPVGMVTGEAGALAVTVALEHRTDLREININRDLMEKLQNKIIENGGYIENREMANPLEKEYAYEEMKNLRRMGLLSGGYHNEYYFSEIINKWQFDQLFKGLLEYYDKAEFFREIDLYPTFMAIGEQIYQVEKKSTEKPDQASLRKFLQETGITSRLEEKNWTYLEQARLSDVYIILSNYSFYLEEKE